MKKKLIGLAAAALMAVGLASSADAHPIWWHHHHHWHPGFWGPGIGIGLGFGGFGPGPGYYGYEPGWDYSGPCGFEWVTGWYRHHHHMVYGPHRVWVC